MSDQDQVFPPVPYHKAYELASACMQDDADAYYRPFEFGQDKFPELEDGECIVVEYRRKRRAPFEYAELFSMTAVPEYAGEGVA